MKTHGCPYLYSPDSIVQKHIYSDEIMRSALTGISTYSILIICQSRNLSRSEALKWNNHLWVWLRMELTQTGLCPDQGHSSVGLGSWFKRALDSWMRMRQLLFGHTKFVQVNSMLVGIEAEFGASTCFWENGLTIWIGCLSKSVGNVCLWNQVFAGPSLFQMMIPIYTFFWNGLRTQVNRSTWQTDLGLGWKWHKIQ